MSAPIDTLAAYVPNLIAQCLAADFVPISKSTCESFPATALREYSGLTVLAERLAQRKPDSTTKLI